MSCRAYAKSRGLSPNAISEAIRSGRLVKCLVRNEFGQPKIADAALADREMAENTDQTRARGPLFPALAAPVPVLVASLPPSRPAFDIEPPTTDKPPALQVEDNATATQRLKSAQADLAELKRDVERGELVLASEVKKKLEGVFASCKTRLLAIPSRARQALPHLVNADVLVIEDLVREALEDLAAPS